MASTFSIGAEPFWYIVNQAGTSAGGAKLYTRRALNHDEDKATYQSASTATPWENPIIFGLNGVAPGPIFWEFDPAQPDELYYIFVEDAEGNQLWSMNNFSGQGEGGGGGGDTTTFLPLINYISNNQFIDHIDDNTNPGANLVIAPSNHKGFTPSPTAVTPVIGTWGAVGSDIRFVKNVAGTPGTDSITFVTFSLADAALFPSDVTPVEYVKYTCSGAATGETFKAFQFPITQKVKNLSNQIMTFKVWAKVAATAKSIPVFVRQYFGSNTAVASPEVHDQVGTLNLTTSWVQYRITITIPSVAAKTLGAAGSQTDDDALYIQLGMPLDQTSEIWFIKPKLYLGTIINDKEFDEYDEIYSITTTARTGDIRVSLTPNPPRGWVAMNDTSIGNVGSGATGRANKDTFQLYSTIYTSVIDAWAPVSGGRSGGGTTMANAITDFLALKTLTLPKSLGRALAGAGAGSGLTATVLGQNQGADTISLAGTNLPPGTPFNALATGNIPFTPTGAASANVPGTVIGPYTGGSGVPISIIQPTSYFNVFIKL